MLLIEWAKLVTQRGKQGEQRQHGSDGGGIAVISRAGTVCFRNSRVDSHFGIHRETELWGDQHSEVGNQPLEWLVALTCRSSRARRTVRSNQEAELGEPHNTHPCTSNQSRAVRTIS